MMVMIVAQIVFLRLFYINNKFLMERDTKGKLPILQEEVPIKLLSPVTTTDSVLTYF